MLASYRWESPRTITRSISVWERPLPGSRVNVCDASSHPTFCTVVVSQDRKRFNTWRYMGQQIPTCVSNPLAERKQEDLRQRKSDPAAASLGRILRPKQRARSPDVHEGSELCLAESQRDPSESEGERNRRLQTTAV